MERKKVIQFLDEVPDADPALARAWTASLTAKQPFIDAVMLVSVAKVRDGHKLCEAQWRDLLIETIVIERFPQ